MPKQFEDGTEGFTKDELDQAIADATSGLKSNQEKALDEAKAAKRELATLRKQWDGLDADKVRKLVEEADDAERKRQQTEGDWEAREKALTDAHAKERKKDAETIAKLRRTVEHSLVDAELTKAIAAHKGDADLLLPHARQFVEVRETTDGYEAFVTDGNGNAAPGDGQGNPMSFGQLVESKLVEQYPRAFEGTGSSGSGASKSAGGAGDSKTVQAGDDDAFLANVEGIAKGEVVVQQ